MTVTHREIAERMDALNMDGLAAYRKAREAYEEVVAVERASLRELCGGIGHIFKRDPALRDHDSCVICGALRART